MAEMIASAVAQAWDNFLAGLILYLPRVMVTLSIIVAGWLIAAALRVVTRWTLRWLRFDAFTDRIGVSGVLRAADLPPASAVLSSVLFWIIWLGFLLSGIDVLGLAALRGIVAGFGEFVPRLLVALVILAVGFVVANIAWRATLLSAVNARMLSPRLMSNAVRLLIIVLTMAMALDQLAIARSIVLTAFAIAFGAVMLGLAIAFGIGGGGVARRFLEQQFPERPRSDVDEMPHV